VGEGVRNRIARACNHQASKAATTHYPPTPHPPTHPPAPPTTTTHPPKHYTHQEVIPRCPQGPVQRQAVDAQAQRTQQVQGLGAGVVGQVLRQEVTQHKADAAVGLVGAWVGFGVGCMRGGDG